jgi:hypothetical protein
MAEPRDHDADDAGLVFTAHKTHHKRCGAPPRLRNTDNPGLYYGYFENRSGEQFVFTFDRETGTGMVSGGDLGWGYALHNRRAHSPNAVSRIDPFLEFTGRCRVSLYPTG